MRRRITRALLDRIEAPDSGDSRVQDDQVPALWLKVTPAGRKLWCVYYRANGRRRRPTIGEWPTMDIETARRAAREIANDASIGRDLVAVRHAARSAPTMRDLAARYLEEHAEPRKAPASVYEDRRVIDRDVLPVIGDLRVTQVGSGDIARVLRGMRPVAANRARALLSKMLALAETWGLRDKGSNPVAVIPRHREQKRRAALGPAEVARLATALDSYAAAGAWESQCADFVRLLLLTGARRGEMLGARVEDVDAARRLLRVPMNKERNVDKTIPLGDAAWAAIDRRVRAVGAGWLFPSPSRASAAMGSPRAAWRHIRTAAELPPGLRLHDLRHTYASAALGLRYSLEQIGGLLGHSTAATTETYAYLMDDPRAAAARSIDAALDGMMRSRN